MIYVLGGTQRSLEQNFRMASALYQKGLADKIFFLSRPGITEYSRELSRNMTNDEWSIRELEKSGVSSQKTEAVAVPSHVFGTYSEAKRISRLAKARGYKRLLLISSLYHTRRVYQTFSRFLGGEVEIFVYGSNDQAGLGALLVEYAKCVGYSRVLLPLAVRFEE